MSSPLPISEHAYQLLTKSFSALLPLYEHGGHILSNEEHKSLPSYRKHILAPFSNRLLEVEGTIDFKISSPFILHTLYKAASILMDRIKIGDSSETSLDNLRIFQRMLKYLSGKWLAEGKSFIGITELLRANFKKNVI